MRTLPCRLELTGRFCLVGVPRLRLLLGLAVLAATGVLISLFARLISFSYSPGSITSVDPCARHSIAGSRQDAKKTNDAQKNTPDAARAVRNGNLVSRPLEMNSASDRKNSVHDLC